MRTYPTVFGPTKVITLKEFLKRVPSRSTDKPIHQYNTCVKHAIFSSGIMGDMQYDSNYERRIATLVSMPLEEVAAAVIPRQSKGHSQYKRPLLEVLEEAQIQVIENFGMAEYAVRLAPRTWLIGDPEAFQIVTRGPRCTIVNLQEGQTRVYSIDRKLETEVVEEIKKYSDTNGLKFDLNELLASIR